MFVDIVLGSERAGIRIAAEIMSQHDIPVVFVTAYSDEATVAEAERSNPYGYVVKPYNAALLRIALTNALRRHSAEAQLRRNEVILRSALHDVAQQAQAISDLSTETLSRISNVDRT